MVKPASGTLWRCVSTLQHNSNSKWMRHYLWEALDKYPCILQGHPSWADGFSVFWMISEFLPETELCFIIIKGNPQSNLTQLENQRRPCRPSGSVWSENLFHPREPVSIGWAGSWPWCLVWRAVVLVVVHVCVSGCGAGCSRLGQRVTGMGGPTVLCSNLCPHRPPNIPSEEGGRGALLGSGASMVDMMMGAPVRRATFW